MDIYIYIYISEFLSFEQEANPFGRRFKRFGDYTRFQRYIDAVNKGEEGPQTQCIPFLFWELLACKVRVGEKPGMCP